MRSRNLGMFGMMLQAAASSFGVISNVQPVAPGLDGTEVFRRTTRGKGQNTRRGKGKQAKPKRRPNMRLVSKRVRRKHRRARG